MEGGEARLSENGPLPSVDAVSRREKRAPSQIGNSKDSAHSCSLPWRAMRSPNQRVTPSESECRD